MSDERLRLPSASSIHRLAACAGSHRLCQSVADRSTPDSEFGQHVHEYLAGKRKAEDMMPEELDIAESCEHIERKLVNEWQARLGFEADESEITISRDETRLWLEIDGEKACSGVADVIRMHDGHVQILDFKALPGDHKDASENAQLRCLAVLADANFKGVKSVTVAIIQPLVTHSPKVCAYDAADLVLARFELVRILEAAKKPDAPLKTGDHCKFCRASSICPAVRAEVTQLSALTIHESGLSVSDEEMAELRARTGAAKKMIASIEAEAFRRAQADPELWKSMGWEISEGEGKRTVTDTTQVCERLNLAGAAWTDIAAEVSLTIGSVEKLARAATGMKGVKLKNAVQTLLDGCCEVKKSAPSLKRIGSPEE